MLTVDFGSNTVLITGGTRGLGKAIGVEFARGGATVFLTHRWGSVNEDDLMVEFRAEGLPAPHVVESDASDAESTRELLQGIKRQTGQLDIVISNVAFAKLVNDFADFKRNALELSMRYSAWPLVDLLHASRDVFGTFPRYALGISSDGGEICHEGYDFAGASKAVLETLCRYLALRLKPEGVRVNAVRPGFLDTASTRATFGDEAIDAAKARMGDLFLDPRGVARVCVALCSGLMDAVTGQVVVVDEGWSLVGPISYLNSGLPIGSSKREAGR